MADRVTKAERLAFKGTPGGAKCVNHPEKTAMFHSPRTGFLCEDCSRERREAAGGS